MSKTLLQSTSFADFKSTYKKEGGNPNSGAGFPPSSSTLSLTGAGPHPNGALSAKNINISSTYVGGGVGTQSAATLAVGSPIKG